MTSTRPPELDAPAPWLGIDTGDETVAVAERGALGTSARVAVWPPEQLDRALAAVDRVLAALDVQASRFRPDSEISWIHRGNGGLFMLSDGLMEAVSVALEAARWTGGLVDPTVGDALITLGYDRDFAAIGPDRNESPDPPQPAPGWQRVRLNGPLLEFRPASGLTWGRPPRAWDPTGRPGPPGWPAARRRGAGQSRRRHRGGRPAPPTAADPGGGQAGRSRAHPRTSAGPAGRRGRRDLVHHLPQLAAGRRLLHHIVDPRTGRPAMAPRGRRPPWPLHDLCRRLRCVRLPRSRPAARPRPGWTRAGLPARLVAHDGDVRYVGGWPDADGGRVEAPTVSHVYGGSRLRGGSR